MRFAWKGAAVCAIVLLLAGIAQFAWNARTERNWQHLKSRNQEALAATIQSRITGLIETQRARGAAVCADADVSKGMETKAPASLASAFQRLEDFNRGSDGSIDVVDTSGSIILWTGRTVVPSYTPSIHHTNGSSLVFVSQARLHRYLSVGIPAPNGRFYVFIGQPLETTYPVSNRFVSSTSLADDLADETGIPVRFATEVAARDTSSDAGFSIPLYDTTHKLICYAIAPTPTLVADEQSTDRYFDSVKSIAAGIGLVFLAVLAFLLAGNLPGRHSSDLAVIVLTWVVRICWRLTSFPASLLGGFLFDPAIHSSPFPLGLAGTLGELLISSAAVVVTLLSLLRITHRWWLSKIPATTNRLVPVLRLLGGALLIFVYQWLVRAYGASMRSFVFDSTIRYRDPMALIPNAPMIVMHLSILFLTIGLAAAGLAVALAASRWMGQYTTSGRVRWQSVVRVSVVWLAAYTAYLWLDQPAQLPVLLPLFLYGGLVGGSVLLELRGPSWQPWRWRPISMGALVLSCMFLFVLFALDAKTHEKEKERAQLMAEELLRPVDSWLSLVVSESLRGASARAVDQLANEVSDSTLSVDLAFSLWAQTLVSKEGYNSALVVYDPFGKELSRFSVGLTSVDQMDLLTQLFHKEEGSLLVVDRKVSDGAVKYYGEWGYVLDQDNHPVGSIALVMSASQKTLFRGEAPEQLRSASREPFEDAFRKVTVSEYRDGELWSTNDPVLFRGIRLGPDVEGELANSTGRFVWTEQEFEGETSDVLYAKDDADRSRILSLRIGALDIRWHLFNAVKTLLVYLLFFALGSAVVTVPLLASGRRPRIGFREKLITYFAILSVLPLLVMAYYNRELAIDRLDQNITKRLVEDLSLTQQRINSVVENEQDFDHLDNDFCEVAASDLGVDFSIYHGPELKASSRPELFRSSILDNRLTGTAFVNTVVLGRAFYETQETIGEVSYVVGYRPLVLGDSVRGVLAVPALYRQQEIDEELAQRNAFVLGAYALVVSLVIGLALVVANALSRPLRELSAAARRVGKGDLDVVLQAKSNDEVGDLIRSFNDMTSELKASRATLARAEREMAWKEMAKQVAHEIKNPLTPIKLSIQHLVQAYRQGAKDFGEILGRVSQTVIEQIDVLTRIASEFSNFARMPERRFERVDLNELLTETINLFREVEGVEFRFESPGAPAIVVADRDELRRVFINIVRNSVQAMESRGTVSIEMSTHQQICSIRISDTGGGIPENIQTKVFQPNFSTKTDGMGLGLAITQKVIEDLDGTISLTSTLGKGTTVEMRIPLRHG
ncbi:MAG TPA: ATP-binding protein [Bacteroidota bacterium]|nr:ATP-binding protein [Bacteroidota bacterium]